MIREAREDDLETLFAIQRTASLVAYAHVFPPERYPYPDVEVRELLRRYLSDSDVTILLAAESGFVSFSPGWLRQLFVLPDAWGQGLGSELHDAAVARLRELACESVFLWVLERNERARGFYERRGWAPDGQTRVAPFPPYPRTLGYVRRL